MEGSKESDAMASLRVPTHMRGLGSSGGAVMERKGLDLSQSVQEVSKAKLDDGGSGGDIGKGISNGGGGDGDDGDDDDYYDEGDDEEEDEGFFSTRTVLPELFDRASINAVLQEWFKTMRDLPTGVRMAVEMGLISSLQIARLLTVESRPNLVRAVSRATPPVVSRAFVGRLMADPEFLVKLGVEQALTIGAALAYEVSHRGDNFKKEWDLALTNVATLAASNAALVWMMAPSRSYGAAHKYSWQSMLHNMPNYVFDKEGPLRAYSPVTRGTSLVVKAAELSAVGMLAGAANSGLQQALVAAHVARDPNFKPSLPVPDMQNGALTMGAYMGLVSNVRYQLIGGLDRWMHQYLNSLSVALFSTTVVRFLNNQLGEPTRLHWMGLPTVAPKRVDEQAEIRRKAAYAAAARRAQSRRRASIQQAAAQQEATMAADGSFSVSAEAPTERASTRRRRRETASASL